MYEEQPRYIGTLGKERTFGQLNFWSCLAASGSFLLVLIVGQGLGWPLPAYLLFGLPFIVSCTALMMEYHGILWVQRIFLLLVFYALSPTRLHLLDARSLYADDAATEDRPVLLLERVGPDDRPLLGRALEDAA
jgi:hypothetical protein